MSVSKSLKPILVSAAVIVVIAIALVLLLVVFPEKEPVEALPPEESAPAQETIYVIKEDSESLVHTTSYYSTGETFSVDYSKNEDGTYSYEAYPHTEFFEYNTSKFRSMMFTLTNLTAIAMVEENAEDISAYGLDEPRFRMEISFADGRTINLYVGDETPVDSNFYIMTDQSNAVYTLGNYMANLIIRPEIEYRNIAVFPQYTEEDIYTNINWVRLTKRGEAPIDIHYDPEFTIDGNKASSVYMMLSPVLSSCADEKVQEEVLDKVAATSYEGIVCDITADELGDYGFDDPARLEMTDVSGNSLDIVLGKFVGSHIYAALGEQYDAFMDGEYSRLTVLVYSAASFEWLELDYKTLLNRAVWIQDIHSVASIRYDMAGEVYELELSEYDDVTASEIEVVRTVGVLNGKDINEKNTKRLFSRTLNLRQVGEVPADAQLAAAEYTITLTLRDGGTRVLELAPMNDRQYACTVDGKREFYVYKTNITNILTSLERVMDDRDVSLIYNT